jgi:hypothetical protein
MEWCGQVTQARTSLFEQMEAAFRGRHPEIDLGRFQGSARESGDRTMVRHLHGSRRREPLAAERVGQTSRPGERREEAEAHIPESPDVRGSEVRGDRDDDVRMGDERRVGRAVVRIDGEHRQARLARTELERSVEDEHRRVCGGVIDGFLA